MFLCSHVSTFYDFPTSKALLYPNAITQQERFLPPIFHQPPPLPSFVICLALSPSVPSFLLLQTAAVNLMQQLWGGSCSVFHREASFEFQTCRALRLIALTLASLETRSRHFLLIRWSCNIDSWALICQLPWQCQDPSKSADTMRVSWVRERFIVTEAKD